MHNNNKLQSLRSLRNLHAYSRRDKTKPKVSSDKLCAAVALRARSRARADFAVAGRALAGLGWPASALHSTHSSQLLGRAVGPGASAALALL